MLEEATILGEATLDDQYGIDVAGVGTNNGYVGVGTNLNVGGGVGASLDGQRGCVGASLAVVDILTQYKTLGVASVRASLEVASVTA